MIALSPGFPETGAWDLTTTATAKGDSAERNAVALLKNSSNISLCRNISVPRQRDIVTWPPHPCMYEDHGLMNMSQPTSPPQVLVRLSSPKSLLPLLPSVQNSLRFVTVRAKSERQLKYCCRTFFGRATPEHAGACPYRV